MKKLLTKIQLAVALLAGVLLLAAPTIVSAQGAAQLQGNKEAVCKGVALTGGDCNADAEGQVNKIIETVINILSVLVGVASVIMIIIGGFKYVTSNGDSNSIGSAKNTILYAVIGLVIVAMAQTIVQFTIRRATVPSATQTLQNAADDAAEAAKP